MIFSIFCLGEGDRLLKKSRYIPKQLLSRIDKMEGEKVSVKEILKVLRHGNKK